MGRRIGIFAIIVFTLVPALASGVTVGSLFLPRQNQVEETRETFARQNTKQEALLLADEDGSAFMVCQIEDGATRLISILPTAAPKGEEDTTFLSLYRQEGIEGLQQKITQSLSCTLTGYLEVDFSGLALVVDALGGVEMEGRSYSGQELQTYLRNLPEDNKGAMAQQEAVLAIGRRFCNAGLWKGQGGLRKLLRITKTDLSVSDLLRIGNKLIPALEGKGLYRYCLPEQGKWKTPEDSGFTMAISDHVMSQKYLKNKTIMEIISYSNQSKSIK